jgi:hypothetical protein
MAPLRAPAAALLLGALLPLMAYSCGAAPLSGWVSGTASFFGGPPVSSVSSPYQLPGARRSRFAGSRDRLSGIAITHPQDQPLNAFNLTIPTGSCGYGSIDPRLYPFYYVVGGRAADAADAWVGRPR